MSGIVMINDEEINNISLQFSTNCDLFGQKIHLKTMRVENLFFGQIEIGRAHV